LYHSIFIITNSMPSGIQTLKLHIFPDTCPYCGPAVIDFLLPARRPKVSYSCQQPGHGKTTPAPLLTTVLGAPEQHWERSIVSLYSYVKLRTARCITYPHNCHHIAFVRYYYNNLLSLFRIFFFCTTVYTTFTVFFVGLFYENKIKLQQPPEIVLCYFALPVLTCITHQHL
jgi:hypothetical protein